MHLTLILVQEFVYVPFTYAHMVSHLLVDDSGHKSTAQVMALGGSQKCLIRDGRQDFSVFRGNSARSKHRPVSSMVTKTRILVFLY